MLRRGDGEPSSREKAVEPKIHLADILGGRDASNEGATARNELNGLALEVFDINSGQVTILLGINVDDETEGIELVNKLGNMRHEAEPSAAANLLQDFVGG